MAKEQKKNTCELYEIKLQGHLDIKWSEWFYNMTITHEDDGATTLCGPLPDQTVLHSVLDRIRDMNLRLTSVNKIVTSGQTINSEVNGGVKKSNASTSQKIGLVIFTLGAIYMVGSGWLYSWKVVPTIDQFGWNALPGWLGFIWGLSVPLGAFIVAIGAAVSAGAERRAFWSLILLLLLFTVWQIVGTTRELISALLGIGGGLITLFFLGSTWHWAQIRPTLNGAAKTGSDLRMVGFIFFVVAAWNLCGIFGVGNFVLQPELAAKFSVPISSTINAASGVNILLVLGMGFNYFGQLLSRRASVADPLADKVSQIAAAD